MVAGRLSGPNPPHWLPHKTLFSALHKNLSVAPIKHHRGVACRFSRYSVGAAKRRRYDVDKGAEYTASWCYDVDKVALRSIAAAEWCYSIDERDLFTVMAAAKRYYNIDGSVSRSVTVA